MTDHPTTATGARGYSWPTATAGNTIAQKHAAHSPRTIAPIAEQLRAELAEAAPWTTSPAFAGAAASWAWSEGQASVLRNWIASHDLLDQDADGIDIEPAAWKLLDRIEGRLAKLRDQLGLTPQSLGKLLATAAQVAGATGDAESLATLQAEGRRILAARLTTTDDEPEPDDDTEAAP